VQRDAGDDEPEARGLDGSRDLREHRDPDDRRGRRQQRDEQRVGCPPEASSASWSQTQGMTEEATPTPTPASTTT